jgi:zinc transporter ZupT
MDNRFWTTLGVSVLAMVFTTLGLYVIRHFENWGRHSTTYFVAFAAGVLISVSFLHLIPEALEHASHGPMLVLIGYMAVYLFNRFVARYVCDSPHTADYALGLVPAIGIGIHSFIDGVIYSVTFEVSVFTGSLASVGMILHEFPEGIVLYLLLLKGGFDKRKAIWYAFFFAALSTPLGMIVSYPLVSSISHETLYGLLALSGGTLIYVGATHLLPHAEHEPRKYSLIAVATGIAVAVLIVLTENH